MNIDDYSFHDAHILEVTEISSEQTFNFLLDFPVDWENNVFEKRVLRFVNVINYFIEEIPFAGNPAILQIINLGEIVDVFGSTKNKIEIQTNAGKRTLEFSNCELINPNE